MTAMLMTAFVFPASVSALALAEIARAQPAVDNPAGPPAVEGSEKASGMPLAESSPEKTPGQRLQDDEFPVFKGCKTACKERYFKEIKKCRRLLSTTFKRQLCIRRANEFGRVCKSSCL